jgi:hypothetical protein
MLLRICVEVAGDDGLDNDASDWNDLDTSGCEVLPKGAPQLLQ